MALQAISEFAYVPAGGGYHAVVCSLKSGHRIYALKTPLQPGDSVRLSFNVHVEARGFLPSGASASVVPNGTWFMSHHWLPAIGYQSSRELIIPGQRRAHGLAQRPLFPSLADVEAGQDITGEASQEPRCA